MHNCGEGHFRVDTGSLADETLERMLGFFETAFSC